MNHLLQEHFGLTVTMCILFLALVSAISSFIAVQIGMREIRRMFKDALAHARSFDPLVERLQTERERDRKALDSGVFPRLAKHEDQLIEHDGRLRSLESRPGLLVGRGES